MKYYLLSNSTDKKEIGHYIQTIMGEVPNEDGEFEKNARSNLNEESFPNFIPNLDFELEKKAKLTDIVSASNIMARGFLMNEKTKALFSQFNIRNHKFYDATLKVKDKILPYFWMHLTNDSFEGIDFQRSVFCEADLTGDKIKELKILNQEDYFKKNALCENMNSIIADKIVFTESFYATKFDLFFFPHIHQKIIASEKLVNSLIKEKISGIKYKEALFLS